MDKDYANFVERMGSFDMELPELPPSKPTNFVKENKELKHFGVKGMRWGIRRSTPTQMSKAKTAADEGSRISKEGSNLVKTYGSVRNARKSEDLSKLSDAELKSKIDRMNLEQQYSNLNSSQVSKGQVYARSALEVAGSVLAIGSSAMTIALAMHKLKGG